MMRPIPGLVVLGVLLLAVTPLASRTLSLRPSRSSLVNQNRQAKAHDYTYIRDSAQLSYFVKKGLLVRLPGNRDYGLSAVSFPYVRPQVRVFVERLSRQYRSACGERLVVTSATRPRHNQPPNASPHSVHPTGMALDLRRSRRRSCRRWLERTLLYLEGRNVLEASFEEWPPHYHVVVFPDPYRRYVSTLNAGAPKTHRVRRGDTLWAIAQRYRTSVGSLSKANRLSGETIRPGQVLKLPATP